MIWGIAAAVLMALAALKFVTKRLPGRRLDAFARRIHPYASAGALTVCAAHVAVTFGLLPQRPAAMVAAGIVMAAALLAAVLSRVLARRMGRRWLTVHRAATLAACAALVAHIALGVAGFGAYQRAIAALDVPDIALTGVADGTYEGECDAGYIRARVEVTVEDGRITEIGLLEHRNERGAAAEALLPEVVEAQSLDVDAVSGATNSSKVIRQAIADALEKGMKHQ